MVKTYDSSEARKIFLHSERILKAAYRGDGPVVTAIAMGRAAGVAIAMTSKGSARDFAKKAFAEMFLAGAAEQGVLIEMKLLEKDPPVGDSE